MRRLIPVLASAGIVLGVMSCVTGRVADPAAEVTSQWAAHGGSHSEQRHSPLTQINAGNVTQLGVAWFAEIPEKGGYQTTPLVVDGTMVVTTPWSKAYAYDAKTGAFKWKYDPQVPREIAATSLCCNVTNRGVAYWNGKAIWGTLDGRLVAVDIQTGKLVWEAQTTDPEKALSITGAPRIGNGAATCRPGMPRPARRSGTGGWCPATRPTASSSPNSNGPPRPGRASGGRPAAAARRGTACSTTPRLIL
jgi:hypothetical protein